MIKCAVTIFCFLCSLLCFSQSESGSDTICLERRALPEAEIKATIKGYRFANEVDVRRATLKSNFSLTLSDKSFEIVGFEFYYYSEEGDAYQRTVCGENMLIAKYPIFNTLRPGGLFEFTNITVEKGGIKYRVPAFMVFPTE